MKAMRRLSFILILVLALIAAFRGGGWGAGPPVQSDLEPSATVGSAFTYQGRLTDGGGPANGAYDFVFKLFDAPTGGAQLMTEVIKEDVVVTDGLFTVELDFGDVFDDTAFWLQIEVRPGNDSGAYTVLSPRQALTPAPYAMHVPGTWRVDGNAGTDPPGDFLGTTNAVPLVFKADGNEAMRINTDGRISVGDALLTAQLDATSDTDVALRGQSNSDVGVMGVSDSSPGMYGSSNSNIGVLGISDNHIGVSGVALLNSGDTEGVVGRVNSPAGEAIQAENVSNGPNANIIAGCSLRNCQEVEFLVQRDGDVLADGSFTGPADFAEMMDIAGAKEQYEPGDVLVIGGDGRLALSSSPYATNLAGVYSTRPGFLGDTEITEHGLNRIENAGAMEADAAAKSRVPVALMGIVPVKVTAENGAIEPGDLLTASSVTGHAMKAEPVMVNGVEVYPTGTIIGKALEPLEQGTGVIETLMSLR